MPPKRISKGNQTETGSLRPRKRTIRHLNSHNIIYDNPEHKRMYSSHVKRKIAPTRYLCSDTLFQLGLSEELDRMFHVLDMLEFVHCEVPTYERITLEFLSTIEFKLKKRMDRYNDVLWGNNEFQVIQCRLRVDSGAVG